MSEPRKIEGMIGTYGDDDLVRWASDGSSRPRLDDALRAATRARLLRVAIGPSYGSEVEGGLARADVEVLVETGLAGFSVEAVSTRSGVARTTIYRWWPTRGTLAVESLLVHLRPRLAYASEGPVAAAFAALVCSLAEALAGPAGRVSASILAEAQSDGETRRRFVAEFSAPLRRETEALLRRGADTGEFRADLDVERVIDAAVGGVYLRLLLGRPLSRPWAEALVDTLLRGVAAR